MRTSHWAAVARIVGLLGLSLTLATPGSAQPSKIRFDHLTRAEGLSQVTVPSILQDRQGFMWFGTQEGLNRYDGFTVTVFKHDPMDPGSISGNIISGLWEDRSGQLWVATQQRGFNRFDPRIERFHRYVNHPDDPNSLGPGQLNPAAFYEDRDGRICIGSLGSGINRIDPDTKTVVRVINDPDDPHSLSDDRVSFIHEDHNGTVWVGTFGGGLEQLLAGGEGDRFVHHRHDPQDPTSISSDVVSAIFEDGDGYLWIGTLGGGLNRFDPASKTCQRFRHDPQDDNSLASDITSPLPTAIVPDQQGNLWIITNLGLSRYDPKAGRFTNYLGDPEATNGLSNPTISWVHCDRTGTIWVGTQGGGLNRHDRKSDSFEVYGNDPADPGCLGSEFVITIHESRSGIVWLGTNTNGVSFFSPQKHKFLHFAGSSPSNSLGDSMIFALLEDRAQTLWVGTMANGLHRLDSSREQVLSSYTVRSAPPRNLANNTVRAICEDSEGKIWAGTQGAGLVVIDPDQERIIRRYFPDRNDPGSLSNNFVNSIYEDSRGDIWVATNFGWNHFNRETESFHAYFNQSGDPTSLVSSFVRFTYEDSSGSLWLGTAGGLSHFNRESLTFGNYAHDISGPESLSHNNVMDLLEGSDGGMWVATYGGGLDRLDPTTGQFEHFTIRDCLPSDSLYSVLADQRGFYWVSSNNGMTRFDPRTRACVNFDVSDGLQSNEFNGRSFTKTASGEMLFGGVNGFNSFHPDKIEPSPYVPPVFITAFRIFDQLQQPGLACHELERVVLSYRDSFSFEFSALDFAQPDRTQYAYMMEGLDEDWIASGNRRFASYNRLPGGRYSFRVKGSNGDGVFNEDAATIAVVIVPPLYKTWWAYTLYLLAAGAGIFAYVRFKNQVHARELARHREDAERQRTLAERLQQVDRMKDEFLANTSHELRTPLNGIIGIAESLIDGATGRLSEPTATNLFMIAASGRRLSHLVDDILDFSKLKNRQIELNRRAVGMREIVDVVLTLSQPLVSDRDLELKNQVAADLARVDGDENRLQQIMHNLVGNAIKFTTSGTITVSARQQDQRIVVGVADTGIGIPAEQLGKIFDSFEQVDGSSARQFAGTGLGLTITRQLVELHGGEISVESKPGEGSTFSFSLPVFTGAATGEEVSPEATRVTQIRDLSGCAGGALRRGSDRTGDRTGDAEPSQPGPDPAPSASAGRVLIVDDEAINLQVLSNILGLSGYESVQASDGHQALERVKQEVPDLILLDVMMPRLTGFEVAREIRLTYSANQLPIILVTAKNQVSDLVEGLAAGANDYLSKPFSSNELLARIRTHLGLSRAHTVEAENRRKSEELEQARAIQLAMLPKAPPPLDHLDIAVHMATASEVGGDYYDFFPQADGSLFVITGDATGHGMSAGMMVAMTKSALRALDVQSPHVLLTQLNGVIRAVDLERMKMALNVACITGSEIALSSAAMPPAFLYRAEESAVEEILIPGLPLGGMGESEYTLRVTEYARDDVLVLISDGLPEWRNTENELLGYLAVEQCIAANGRQSAAEIRDALVSLGETWSDGHPNDDDVTVMVIKRR